MTFSVPNLFPILLLLLCCSIFELGHAGGDAPAPSASESDEPNTPALPDPLAKLNEKEQDCLFLIFTKSKLFEDPKVQQGLANQSCDSTNSSKPDIWTSRQKDNGWCELNLDRVNSEFGPMVMHAQGAVASNNGARLFVKTTKHGIWIALYQPQCNANMKNNEQVAEETVRRARRWASILN